MKDRFKQIREYFGLSQTQFAQKINRSPGGIGSIETGRSSVPDETIDSVCEAFGINRSWLVSGDGAMFAPGKEKSKADKEGIGERIRKVRKDTGLTQEEFGKAIGCSVTYIHFVESGKNIPSSDFLKKVCMSFCISYNWLLTGEGEEKEDIKPMDDELIKWVNEHPDVLHRLRVESGLE